jgi:DNA-binding transcriptional MerR regulator
MSPSDAPLYSLTEVAGLAGVTPRTVRYYMAQGLLPSPGTSGPGPKYDDGHLNRLRLIRKLQREHLPLAEIRQRLASLDEQTIATLANQPATTPTDDSALDYIRRVLSPQPPPQSAPTPAARAFLARRLDRTPSGLEPPRSLLRTAVPEPRLDRSQWERVTLAPDIELHIRRPLSRPVAKKVDRLISIARDLLEEDPS